MKETKKLTLEGNCVLSIIYETKNRASYNEIDCKLFEKMHFQRIEISDAIFVVNVNGYIGETTKDNGDAITSFIIKNSSVGLEKNPQTLDGITDLVLLGVFRL